MRVLGREVNTIEDNLRVDKITSVNASPVHFPWSSYEDFIYFGCLIKILMFTIRNFREKK